MLQNIEEISVYIGIRISCKIGIRLLWTKDILKFILVQW